MANAPVLIVIDPLEGVPYEGGRDILTITRQSDPSRWALAVARSALWLIGGQWRYDLNKGIDYQKILGEVPDIRFVEESMRRTLAAYFTVRRLTAKQDGGDLRVAFVGVVDGVEVSGSVSFAEGLTTEAITVLGYKVNDTSITIQFSAELSPWNIPSPSDFEFRGFSLVPTITGASVNGQVLTLATTGSLASSATQPSVLLYEPSSAQQLQSVTRAPVGSFRLPIEAGFDPRQLSGLKLYLNADVGVTESASAVSQWDDLSGQLNHVSQSSGGLKPTLVSAWRNGKAALQFGGGSAKTLWRATFTGGEIPSGRTVVVVADFATETPPGVYALIDSRNGAKRSVIYDAGDGNAFWMYGASGLAMSRVGSGPGIACAEYNAAASVMKQTVQGKASQTTPAGTVGTNTMDGVTIGAQINDTGYTNSKIAMVLIYDRILTEAEKWDLETWICGYYSINTAAADLPLRIPGSPLYLNADQGLTMGAGSDVASWADKSGKGNDVSNPGNRPTLVSGWRNGKNALQGTAFAYLQRVALAGGAIPQPYTIAAAGEWGAVAGTYVLCGAGAVAAANVIELSNVTALSAGANSGAGARVLGAPFVGINTFAGAASEVRYSFHGAAPTANTVNPGTNALNGFLVGGDYLASILRWLGKYSFFAVYSRSLTAFEKTQLETWAKSYYNVVTL